MKEKYIIRHKYWLSTHLWFYWRCWHDVCWWCWNGFGKLRNVEMLFYSTEYLNLTCVNITSWCQQPPWCTVMTMSQCHAWHRRTRLQISLMIRPPIWHDSFCFCLAPVSGVLTTAVLCWCGRGLVWFCRCRRRRSISDSSWLPPTVKN